MFLSIAWRRFNGYSNKQGGVADAEEVHVCDRKARLTQFMALVNTQRQTLSAVFVVAVVSGKALLNDFYRRVT